MNEQNLTESATRSAAERFLPVLLVLFVGSGCAALIYEIVWFQLLQLVIGSSAVSLGVLLGTFMGGMCLGSLALPRLVSPWRHPLRVYALIELGIGTIGIVVLFGMPFLDRAYAANVGSGFSAVLLRGAVCAVCLLPPTMLMGATLPAIARWIEATPRGISWLGLFYGGNIAGAVFGCLLAGFYLLRVHDMAVATYVAAGVNGTVAALSLLVERLTHQAVDSRQQAAVSEPGVGGGPAPSDGRGSDRAGRGSPDPAPGSGLWLVYLTIALSGACALAAEVIWTRLLSLMLGATVYTFSIILAVFLIGLGVGSGVGSFVGRATPRPRLLLGGCQLLLAAAIAWTAYQLAASMPFWPIDPQLSRSPWQGFQLDLVRCWYAIFPATCLWGASFPLALATGAARGQDPGRLVGGMYAANTVGAIVGAVGTSLFLIRDLGTQDGQRVLIGLCAVAALLMLGPHLWHFLRNAAASRGWIAALQVRVAGVIMLAVAAVGLVAFLIDCVPAVPWQLVALGRSLPKQDNGQWAPLYVGEGMNASVAVTTYSGSFRSFHVSGKVEASSEPNDMRLQRMLGHLPALLHPKPRSVLIVGCGAGVTAGCFVVEPEIERIVICEIEPLVPQAIAPYFTKENHDVVNDPRVEIVYDDARHYILTTPYTFDIITSDPIHPWVKGSATLYTAEYFELCKRRLNPGGLITQWVPLYETNMNVVRSELATFFDVFPHGTIWSNNLNGLGYDTVLLGQTEPLRIDADELQERLNSPARDAVRQALQEVGFETVVGLLESYAGQAHDLHPWLSNANINRDRNLRLQYLAGMELNTNESAFILRMILSYRRFPQELFTGTGLYGRSLRLGIEKSISDYQSGILGQQPSLFP
jgi:spermidine synthase